MNREQRDGLFMDNSVFILDEKKPGFPLQYRIIQFLAILIGSISSIAILLESIPVPARVAAVNMIILLCAGAVYALCLIPSYSAVKIFFGILVYVLFFLSRFPKLQNGFYILENIVIDRMSANYDFRTSHYVADYDAAAADSTLLVVMITIPIVTLFTIAIVKNRFINMTAILLFLPVAICFLFGLTPPEKYLVAFIAAILYLTCSGFTAQHLINKEQKVILHRINSWAAVWLCLISIAAFFFLKLFVPQEKYEDISQIKVMKKEIQTMLNSYTLEDITNGIVSFKLPTFNLPTGGLEGGKLTNSGSVEYKGSEQLLISAPAHTLVNGIYLKGYVGSEYTGYSWKDHSADEAALLKDYMNHTSAEYFSPGNQVPDFIQSCEQNKLLLGFNIDTMRVEYKGANRRFFYSPYYTDFEELGNVTYKQDLYAAPAKKKDSYVFNFYDIQMLTQKNLIRMVSRDNSDYRLNLYKLGDYSDSEEFYRRFVYQTYTKLPETGLVLLKQQCARVMKENPSYTLYDKIAYIRSYLNVNTSYTLSPGKLPAGKDYVEYFLYENKKGYCAHYASAAALMLRAMGVPARYVEGYAVSPADIAKNTVIPDDRVAENGLIGNTSAHTQVEVSVKDYNAHAWVEVYLDNVGWIPVEFTPSFNAGAAQDAPVAQLATPTPAPTPTPIINTPQEDNGFYSEKPPQTPSVTGPEIAKEQQKWDSLFLVIFLASAAGLMIGAAAAVLYKRHKIKVMRNRNKRAIHIFSNIEKMLNTYRGIGKNSLFLEESEEYIKKYYYFINADAFTSFMEIIRRARFGRGRISAGDLKHVENVYIKFYEEIYSRLPIHKRIYLKLLLVA